MTKSLYASYFDSAISDTKGHASSFLRPLQESDHDSSSQFLGHKVGCHAIIIGIVIQMSVKIKPLVAEWIAVITPGLDLAGIVRAGLGWELAGEFLKKHLGSAVVAANVMTRR